MKKIILGFAALSLLFVATSCAKESVETSGSDGNKIKFESVLGKSTRATETTIDNLETTAISSAPIPVAVFCQTPNTIDGTWGLYYDGTDWTYGTPENHPGGSIAYYAWYPTGVIGALTTGAYAGATLLYTVKDDPTQQEDLIAANTVSQFPVVPLEFNHVLSQINFAIQGVQDVKVKIENISVNSVYKTNTYTFSTTGGSWGATPTVSQNYTYTPTVAAGNETSGLNTNVLYLGNKGGSDAADNANANALMLLPQTLADAATFSFTFTLTDRINGTVQATDDVTVRFNEYATAWAMGKRYLYIIDFTDYLAGGPIRFTVKVNDWTDATSTTIAQPVIVSDATAGSIEAAIATQNAAKGTTTTLITFPIWVPTDATAQKPIVLKNFATTPTTKFVPGDVIKINFPSAAGVANVTLEASSDMDNNWTLNNTANPVTLTKK